MRRGRTTGIIMSIVLIAIIIFVLRQLGIV